MKCENCGKNEVSFLYRSNVNGQVEEKRLCAECAEKLGYTRRLAASQRNMMRNFFGGGLFGNNSFFGLPDAISDGERESGGNFFDSFFGFPSLMGRMLDNPFDDFFTDMPALGSAPETGEKREALVEQEDEGRFARWRRLNALKAEMKQAVRQENFERAAELRDQIRELEAAKDTARNPSPAENPADGSQA